jgi:hypothetical protein
MQISYFQDEVFWIIGVGEQFFAEKCSLHVEGEDYTAS